jgi:NhaP-type Na+/H+ or K+/H+ antiporter
VLPFVVFALAGASALLAAVLPRLLHDRAFSLPMAFLALGVLLGLVPGLPEVDPTEHETLTEHLTEVVVIISLMGAGLAIDRRVGWRRWRTTWRLLAVAMPLTIVLVAVTGSLLGGLPLAAAVLLGAALAPTDPVLASDVQVGEPSEETDEDEVRFALTSEAGLNDGAAFPAVYLAIGLAAAGGWGTWVGEWVLVDLVLRLAIGVAVGLAVGWLLGRVFFRAEKDFLRLSDDVEGFTALAVCFLAYGLAQLATGYGFVAVFVAACAIRSAERSHGAHQVAHGFVEQVERMLTSWLLLLLGAAIADGLLAGLTWQLALVAVLLIAVIRPLVGFVSTIGTPGGTRERLVIAFFGVRGIGSLYYTAYALANESFPAEELWATVGLAVALSVVVHGLTATPVVARLDAERERLAREDAGHREAGRSAADVRL